MNGVHDLGGMQNFGPVTAEADEPPFHHEWERRAFALTLAMGATGAWNLDQSRSAREALPPAQYLAISYYQVWFAALQSLIVDRGLITQEEAVDGRLRLPPQPIGNVLAAERVAATLVRGSSTQRPAAGSPRFAVGAVVRAVNVNPAGHTRLPRYCRGKRGTIVGLHGKHVFPDTNAREAGENAQWLYTIRFDARELWGADTTAAAVHVDCFEPYLEA